MKVSPWLQGALAGLIAGIVGGGIAAGWVAHDLPAGSLAEWVGGIGTVAALVFAGRQLRADLAARQDESDRAAEGEATLITLDPKISHGSSGGVPWSEGSATVLHGGTRPVHNVVLRAVRGSTVLFEARTAELVPTGRLRGTTGQRVSFAEGDTEQSLVEASWTDAGGRRWTRMPDSLRRVD